MYGKCRLHDSWSQSHNVISERGKDFLRFLQLKAEKILPTLPNNAVTSSSVNKQISVLWGCLFTVHCYKDDIGGHPENLTLINNLDLERSNKCFMKKKIFVQVYLGGIKSCCLVLCFGSWSSPRKLKIIGFFSGSTEDDRRSLASFQVLVLLPLLWQTLLRRTFLEDSSIINLSFKKFVSFKNIMNIKNKCCGVEGSWVPPPTPADGGWEGGLGSQESQYRNTVILLK